MGHPVHSTDISEPFKHTTLYTLSAFWQVQWKLGLICEKDTSPKCQTPLKVSFRPLKSEMTSCSEVKTFMRARRWAFLRRYLTKKTLWLCKPTVTSAMGEFKLFLGLLNSLLLSLAWLSMREKGDKTDTERDREQEEPKWESGQIFTLTVQFYICRCWDPLKVRSFSSLRHQLHWWLAGKEARCGGLSWRGHARSAKARMCCQDDTETAHGRERNIEFTANSSSGRALRHHVNCTLSQNLHIHCGVWWTGLFKTTFYSERSKVNLCNKDAVYSVSNLYATLVRWMANLGKECCAQSQWCFNPTDENC